MSDFIDLVLTTDGAVRKAPEFTYIQPGDLITVRGIKGVQEEVKESITVHMERDVYQFVCDLIELNDMAVGTVETVMTPKKVEWPEEEPDAVPDE